MEGIHVDVEIPTKQSVPSALALGTALELGEAPEADNYYAPTASPHVAPRRYTGKPVKILFAMVGLPARGKSYLSYKIRNFLRWRGTPAEIFNAGNLRRQRLGARETASADFFSQQVRRTLFSFAIACVAISHHGCAARVLQEQPTADPSPKKLSVRDQIAMDTLQMGLQWLRSQPQGEEAVAFFDATNTTRARRVLIRKSLRRFVKDTHCDGIKLIFLESVCNDKNVIRDNLLQKVRNSPDFAGVDEAQALADIEARVRKYEAVYETLDDTEKFAYIKIIDLASKVVCKNVFGQLPLMITQLLMSVHTGRRPVYIVRAGHCRCIDASELEAKRRASVVAARSVVASAASNVLGAEADERSVSDHDLGEMMTPITPGLFGLGVGQEPELSRQVWHRHRSHIVWEDFVLTTVCFNGVFGIAGFPKTAVVVDVRSQAQRERRTSSKYPPRKPPPAVSTHVELFLTVCRKNGRNAWGHSCD